MRTLGYLTQHPFATVCFFLVLSLLAYANAIHHPFVHDDVVFILNNPHIRDFSLSSIFQPKAIDSPAAGLINVYYRPLVELYYRVTFAIFGTQAWGFHLINILIHGINGYLLYRLLCHMKVLANGSALFVSILFVVHPVQTEAVACISGISNLLLFCVMLASFLLYLGGRESQNKLSLLGSMFLLFLGCLVKEQMIVLPVLIGLYEWLLVAKGQRRWKACCSMFMALAGYFVMRRFVLGMTVTGIFDSNGEHWLRFMAIPRSLMSYIGIIVWPVDLHYYRSIDVLDPNAWAWISLGVILIVLAIFTFLTTPEARRRMLFAMGWFGATLLPMLNIVPLVNEYSTLLNFEHFVYIPMIGLSILIVILFQNLVAQMGKDMKRSSLVLALTLIVVCYPLTWMQNRQWRSEVALFTRTLQFQESGRVRMLLAKALYFEGSYPKAIQEYEKSLAIMQGYAEQTPLPQVREFYRGFIKGIFFDLAHCYEALQNPAEAIKMYHRALEIDPRDIVLYNNLAVVYIKEKNFTVAAQTLEKALELDSTSPLTRQNLAYSYVQLGRKPEADALFQSQKDLIHE